MSRRDQIWKEQVPAPWWGCPRLRVGSPGCQPCFCSDLPGTWGKVVDLGFLICNMTGLDFRISVMGFQALGASCSPCGWTVPVLFQATCFLPPSAPFLLNGLWPECTLPVSQSSWPVPRSLDYFWPWEQFFITNLLLLFYPTALHCKLRGLFKYTQVSFHGS